MFRRNIDFFAVLLIVLAILGFTQARSWDVTEAMSSIHVNDAVQIDHCPLSWQMLTDIASRLH